MIITNSVKLNMINTNKDRKRLSRIIKVDFGKGVGISLEELELEFDEMIDGLEQQVSMNTIKHKQTMQGLRFKPTSLQTFEDDAICRVKCLVTPQVVT